MPGSSRPFSVTARRVLRQLAGGAVLLAVLLQPVAARAQELEVPAKLQAALFKKLFAYATTLQGQGVARVVVAHAAGSERTAGQVVAAFKDVGVEASALEARAAAAALGPRSVLYVVPGTDAPAALARATLLGVLCVSGSPQLAEAGKVAVGLGKSADGRTQIVISRARLKEERQELSANVLALARVVP